jgi:hypothetical protein
MLALRFRRIHQAIPNVPCGLRAESFDPSDLVDGCAANGIDAAEMPQQSLATGWADPGDLVQAGPSLGLPPPLAMIRHREAVRFVPYALQ